MPRHTSKAVAIFLVTVCACLVGAASAVAAPQVSGVFKLGTEIEANNKMTLGPEGDMWVTLNDPTHTEDVAKITPSGVVEEFELPGVKETAYSIAVGPEGKLWVPTTNYVTSFSPVDPKPSEETFLITSINSYGEIVAGPEGNMWVASDNSLVHFPPNNPTLLATKEVHFSGQLIPKDIDVAGSLIVIADEAGSTEKPRIDTFTTGGTEKTYELPGTPQGVAGNPGGLIAYSQPTKSPEQVGLISPPTAAAPIDLPEGGDPFGVALGSDEAFWIVLSAKDGLERLTKSGETSFLGGLPKESMARQIAAGPNNTLWVTLTQVSGHSAIARVSGLEPPSSTAPGSTERPQTKITKSPRKRVKAHRPRAKVTFRFRSNTAGAKFECSLSRAKRNGQMPAPRFKSCHSPQTYRLKPGRYRFKVRAVSNGLVGSAVSAPRFRVTRVG